MKVLAPVGFGFIFIAFLMAPVLFFYGLKFLNEIFGLSDLKSNKEVMAEIMEKSRFGDSQFFDPITHRGDLKWRYELTENFVEKLEK